MSPPPPPCPENGRIAATENRLTNNRADDDYDDCDDDAHIPHIITSYDRPTDERWVVREKIRQLARFVARSWITTRPYYNITTYIIIYRFEYVFVYT